MKWLDRIRELDIQLEKEYQERTKNEPGLSKSDFRFLIGLIVVISLAVFFVLAEFTWIGLLITPIYVIIMILLFGKSLFIEDKK